MRIPSSLILLAGCIVVSLPTTTKAFAPPRGIHTSQPTTRQSSHLYFWWNKKGDETSENEKQEENHEDKDSASRIPFFSRLTEQTDTKDGEPATKVVSPSTVSKVETKVTEVTVPTVSVSSRVGSTSRAAVPVRPKAEQPQIEESALDKANALKAQAKRMRLEAERMDAQLTLDKIDRLERELAQARKKGQSVEDLQREMEEMQAKMRGEAPKPRVAPISKTKTLQKAAVMPTVTPKEVALPVNEEDVQEYLDAWNGAPKALKGIMAGLVGLYSSDVDQINATEVALRMEMRHRHDYSFVESEKPEFTKDEIDGIKNDPIFKLRMMAEKSSDDEVARQILEEGYYTSKLAEKYAEETGESSFFEIEISNMTEIDALTENLFPDSTRRLGEAPTLTQVMALLTDVLPKAGFNPSGKPEQVSGGYIIRGTNKLDGNDELVDAIDAQLAASPLQNKLSVFYINDYTIFTEEKADFGTLDSDPILLVTGPNVAPDRKRILLSIVSAFGIASSWYLSIYPFLLNPDLMKRAEEQMQLADSNMAYDLTWLTDLSLPLFATFMGIQLAHELGHRAVSAAYGMNVTVPTFVPSLITGMTSTVTQFKDPPKNKEAMFDFSIAGPLTGIFASLVAMYFGLELTIFSTAETYAQFPALPLEILRQSTLGGALIEFILGRGSLAIPGGAEGTSAIQSINITLHPVAIAGYIGLIVNALALLPVGTSDGGRISLTLFSRGGKIVVGQVFLFLLLICGIVGSDLFLFYFSFLVFFQRGNEIPARNEVDDISFSRVLLATFAGVVALLALIPIT